MVRSFKDYLIEEDKTVYFTFGRMNPPTIGHELLLDTLKSKAGKNPYYVYLSRSQDSKKNPLSYQQKIKYARKMFPKHARHILADKTVKTPIEAVVALYDKGFKNIVMVVGSDRVMHFDALLQQYNGKKARHGFYNFNSIKVVSAGERDPDSDDVSGMSASKQRENAKTNNFTSFSQGMPPSLSNKEAKKLFNDLRVAMGLKENKEFRNHITLNSVSEKREKYIRGDLFNVGDNIVVKESEEIGVIKRLCANYVIVEMKDKVVRKWLDDIELLKD
jgi:hypothetical protein